MERKIAQYYAAVSCHKYVDVSVGVLWSVACINVLRAVTKDPAKLVPRPWSKVYCLIITLLIFILVFATLYTRGMPFIDKYLISYS